MTVKNIMRPLTAHLEDGYCSITVANHLLITVIRFVAKSYTHPWKGFTNRLHLVFHTCEIPFSKNMRARILARSKHGQGLCTLKAWPAGACMAGTSQAEAGRIPNFLKQSHRWLSVFPPLGCHSFSIQQLLLNPLGFLCTTFSINDGWTQIRAQLRWGTCPT